MFLNSGFRRIALAGLLILSTAGFGIADTIRLKDGSIIKGRIINFGDGKFTVVIGEGPRQRQMNFFADEVDTIEFEAIPPVNSNVRPSLPSRPDTSTRDNTVITVGQTETKPVPTPTPMRPVATPTPMPTPAPTPFPTPQPTPSNNSGSKPITLNVKVLADNTANGWTNSGWVVRKGQRIRITAKGQVNLGNGRYSSASGIGSLADKDKLMQKDATGGLIAVVGDDNNDFIFVGTSNEFVAQRDGALFLGVNEGNLEDNSGAFDVTIEIITN